MLSIIFQSATSTSTKIAEEVVQPVDATFSFLNSMQKLFLDNLSNIIAGFVIIIVGIYVAKFAKRVARTVMVRAKYDETVITFIEQIIYYSILFLGVISGLSHWGIPSSSFVAMVGGLGLAVGLALQKNMANFASGLLILIFKPFRVGDWVQVSGNKSIEGNVTRIELLYTVILSKTKRTIFVPNSTMTSNAVINSSFLDSCKIRFDIGISYDADHHKAIAILKDIFRARPWLINPDALEIGITDFADSAVIITVYPEFPRQYFYELYYGAMSDIKDRFDAENISIPYPQRDVHLYTMDSPASENGPVAGKRSPLKSVATKIIQGTPPENFTEPNA